MLPLQNNSTMSTVDDPAGQAYQIRTINFEFHIM